LGFKGLITTVTIKQEFRTRQTGCRKCTYSCHQKIYISDSIRY